MEKNKPIGIKPQRSALPDIYTYNRIAFFLNGSELQYDIPPAMTTMDFLHRELNLWGTKCSCNEGDCGACTVVIASAREGNIAYDAINSCLYPAAKLHGKHLITVEGLGIPDDLHIIQRALLDFHGTQCGYCTPGFVMAMFALFATKNNPTRDDIMHHLEGNLCRCTGYQSILEANLYLAEHYSVQDIVPDWCREVEKSLLASPDSPAQYIEKQSAKLYFTKSYYLPLTFVELFRLMAEKKDQAQYRLLSGGTDIMVQVNISRRKYPCLIDLSGISELNGININHDSIHIRANTTYSQILGSGFIAKKLPALHKIVSQLASNQIRNFATLAGNIGNASPVADTAPLLLVLGTKIVLLSAAGERTLPLAEFFLDYRKTALKEGDIIREIIIPLPDRNSFVDTHKATKRKAVDIAAVTSALRIESDVNGVITDVCLAVGGADKITRISHKFNDFVSGKKLNPEWFEQAAQAAAEDFIPISDVRGSKEYRSRMISNHVLMFLRSFFEQSPVKEANHE